MEDLLTEIPPPSRFHQGDLDNFAPPSPPLPSPFLTLRRAHDDDNNEPRLRPSLLIVAISSPSLRVLHRLPSNTLLGALVLPENPFSGGDSCDVHALTDDLSALLVSVPISVPAERSHAVAAALIGNRIVPKRVVVFDSVQARNFRSHGLSTDDALAFKLETSAEKKRDSVGPKGLFSGYFPSGSVVEGLGAALLARCEVMRIRGTLCVTWPESGSGGPVVSLVKSLVESALPGLDLSSCDGDDDDDDGFSDRRFYSELYT